MVINMIDLENVCRCIEESMPNVNVYIDFEKHDFSTRDKMYGVGLSIRDDEKNCTLFSNSCYDDIFQVYPILLGIYYGICIAKDKPFDYSPTPGDGWDE